MSNAYFKVPHPINEPILSYAPGSPERAALKAKLKEMKSQQIEAPLIIGGKEVRSGKTVQRRQITAGLGYLGQDDEVVHVGLGRARTADVTVHWPDGTQSSHPRLATGAVHTISQAR